MNVDSFGYNLSLIGVDGTVEWTQGIDAHKCAVPPDFIGCYDPDFYYILSPEDGDIISQLDIASFEQWCLGGFIRSDHSEKGPETISYDSAGNETGRVNARLSSVAPMEWSEGQLSFASCDALLAVANEDDVTIRALDAEGKVALTGTSKAQLHFPQSGATYHDDSWGGSLIDVVGISSDASVVAVSVSSNDSVAVVTAQGQLVGTVSVENYRGLQLRGDLLFDIDDSSDSISWTAHVPS